MNSPSASAPPSATHASPLKTRVIPDGGADAWSVTRTESMWTRTFDAIHAGGGRIGTYASGGLGGGEAEEAPEEEKGGGFGRNVRPMWRSRRKS